MMYIYIILYIILYIYIHIYSVIFIDTDISWHHKLRGSMTIKREWNYHRHPQQTLGFHVDQQPSTLPEQDAENDDSRVSEQNGVTSGQFLDDWLTTCNISNILNFPILWTQFSPVGWIPPRNLPVLNHLADSLTKETDHNDGRFNPWCTKNK